MFGSPFSEIEREAEFKILVEGTAGGGWLMAWNSGVKVGSDGSLQIT